LTQHSERTWVCMETPAVEQINPDRDRLAPKVVGAGGQILKKVVSQVAGGGRGLPRRRTTGTRSARRAFADH